MADQAERLRQMVQDMKDKDDRPAPAAHTITVVSGKGGVGKTSFAVNFAVALSQLGKRVVIVDADFGFSNVDILLGVSSKISLVDVVTGRVKLGDAVQMSESGVGYIAGGSGVEELINLSPEGEESLFSQLAQLDEHADIVIFDTGAGMRSTTLRLMQASDETILVLTPEPTSIMDAFVVLKMASGLEERPKVGLMLNKVRNEAEAEETDRNFRNVVEKYLEYELNVIGYMSRDEEVNRSIASLAPLMVRNPGSTAGKQLRKMAGRYLDEQYLTFGAKGVKGFFRKLLSRGK